MSMLAIAYEHAETTEGMAELPAPADTGGFVLEIAELNKVFANAGGAYVELDTEADHEYDATGLIRVHFAGHSPQLGPSDSVLADPKYVIPAGGPIPATTGISVAWQDANGAWLHQGELTPSQITNVSVVTSEADAERVAFAVRYEGDFGGGVSAIEEQYVLTPETVLLTTSLTGYSGPVRRIVPLLSDDGRSVSKIQVHGQEARVWQQDEFGTAKHTFEMEGASTVTISDEQYANHNGFARLAIGEYPVENSSENNSGKSKKGKHAHGSTSGITLKIGTQGGRPF
jgi:hypothetical protein